MMWKTISDTDTDTETETETGHALIWSLKVSVLTLIGSLKVSREFEQLENALEESEKPWPL